MAGRPIIVEWHDSAQDLLARMASESNRHLSRRWQALLLIKRGWSIRSTADFVGVSYRTIEYWLEWYRRGGPSEVVRHRRGRTRASTFVVPTRQHVEALVQEAQTNGFGSQKEAIDWLKERFGVTVSNKEMSHIFRSHGIRRNLPHDALSRLSSLGRRPVDWLEVGDEAPCRLRWQITATRNPM